jgi:hypothetical protein
MCSSTDNYNIQLERNQEHLTFFNYVIYYDMICEWCENEFVQRRFNQRFCKKLCSKYASRKRTGKKRLERWKEQGINMTLEKYNLLFEQQQGKCKICGKSESEFKKRLGVDHDHKTGKTRGLLCDCCNRTIGIFHDDINLFRKIVEYLQS